MNLMQERTEIMRGLLFFWSCKVCHKLGWDQEQCSGEKRKDCGIYLYNKLGTQFVAIHNEKRKAKK